MADTPLSTAAVSRRVYHPLSRNDDYPKLRAQLPALRQVYLDVAVFTGARRAELERFNTYDFDLAEGLIRIRGGKTRPDRRIPLAGELRPFIERHPGGKLLVPWFNIDSDLHAACLAAGIKARIPRDLRETYASWQRQADIGGEELARRLGCNWPDDDDREDPDRDTAPRAQRSYRPLWPEEDQPVYPLQPCRVQRCKNLRKGHQLMCLSCWERLPPATHDAIYDAPTVEACRLAVLEALASLAALKKETASPVKVKAVAPHEPVSTRAPRNARSISRGFSNTKEIAPCCLLPQFCPPLLRPRVPARRRPTKR